MQEPRRDSSCRERRERDRRRIALAPAPARLSLEELGARGAEEQERHGHAPVERGARGTRAAHRRPSGDPRHEDARTTRRHRLEEPAPGGERLLAARRRLRPRRRRRAAPVETRTRRAPLRPAKRPATHRVELRERPRVRSSDSRIPASAFTISPSAQNVMPSP